MQSILRGCHAVRFKLKAGKDLVKCLAQLNVCHLATPPVDGYLVGSRAIEINTRQQYNCPNVQNDSPWPHVPCLTVTQTYNIIAYSRRAHNENLRRLLTGIVSPLSRLPMDLALDYSPASSCRQTNMRHAELGRKDVKVGILISGA